MKAMNDYKVRTPKNADVRAAQSKIVSLLTGQLLLIEKKTLGLRHEVLPLNDKDVKRLADLAKTFVIIAAEERHHAKENQGDLGKVSDEELDKLAKKAKQSLAPKE